LTRYRMDRLGVTEYALLGRAEEPYGQHCAPSASRRPPRNLDVVLRDQGHRRTAPIGFIRQFDFAGGWDIFLGLLLKKFLAIGFILVALSAAAFHAFKSGECDCEQIGRAHV